MNEFLENFDAGNRATSANIHSVTAIASAEMNKDSHAARE